MVLGKAWKPLLAGEKELVGGVQGDRHPHCFPVTITGLTSLSLIPAESPESSVVQWLQLSISSQELAGDYVHLASLVLDVLQYCSAGPKDLELSYRTFPSFCDLGNYV